MKSTKYIYTLTSLREGKKINGSVLHFSYSLQEFFFKYACYGFSKKLLIILTFRVENRLEKKIKEFKISKLFIIYKILASVVPKNKDLKKKTIFNIFLLDLVNSYKGLRHSFGLPVRGQRT
jgi:ribosomal protein S13